MRRTCASVLTCTLHGACALPVTVEVVLGPGLPGMHIVGLPDLAVQEARQRVRSAIRSCGYSLPDVHIVVNLAPGPLKKTGSGFDLPIAVALLIATGQVRGDWVDEALLVGELSLEGDVRAVPGLLACAIAAGELGRTLVCAPTGELARDRGAHTKGIAHIADLRKGPHWTRHPETQTRSGQVAPDYRDIAGEDLAKRALEIAAAGGHGLLLQGPPGSGKTMLARRLPSILPPLDAREQEEVALIHSVAGLAVDGIFDGVRPFRAPHHAASKAGLIGGGNPLRPGEVSLAHDGVLFLDEMSEFPPAVLQALRQPMETGEVVLVRAEGRFVFPARFMLVGAANPCPCGFLGDPDRACTCTPAQISRYASRIGGPLMDRIDLVVDVWRTDPGNVMETGSGMDSLTIREHVLAAREFATRRIAHETTSPDVAPDVALIASCRLDAHDRDRFEDIARRGNLSGRGVMRTLRVARTIADLDGGERVQEEHLMEALTYRVRSGTS